MKLFNDSRLNQEFLANGMVLLNLLSVDDANTLLNSLLKLNPEDGFEPSSSNGSTYHCTFLDQNETYKRAAFNLFLKVFEPYVTNIFNEYTIWNANLYVKPSLTGRFEIHQNWSHIQNEKDTTFTIWCPLVDADEHNGTIQIVRGSHKIVPYYSAKGLPDYFKSIEAVLLEKYLEPICRTAGQAVIFEDGMIHFSEENKSNKPRYAVQVLVGPKNVNPVYYYFNNEKPDVLEVFEVNREFFLTRNRLSIQKRPEGYKSLGYVKNQTKQLSQSEFENTMANGKERRKHIYENLFGTY